MTDILTALRQKLGDSAVLTGDHISGRATSYWDSSPMVAKAILRPKSTEELSEILKICHSYHQPVFTHGGRTSCVEGTKTNADQIIISLELMNKVTEIDCVNATAVIEAGVILERAQNIIADHGMFLPLDLGARGSCTIGGNLATNAGGINVIRYGMARAITLGLEVVLPDGTILSSLNKMLKNNSGYDLKQLFIGTEGTLGIITKAVIRLQPQPLTKNTALATLDDFTSVYKLLGHLKSAIGSNLSAFEIMEGSYFKAVTEPNWHRAPMERDAPYYVLFECDGSDPERDDDRFSEVIEEAFESGLITNAVLPKSEKERQDIWAIRDDFEAILQPKPVYLYDVSLPILSMESYIADVKRHLAKSLPSAKIYCLGHMGDGNLHFFIQPHGSVEDMKASLEKSTDVLKGAAAPSSENTHPSPLKNTVPSPFENTGLSPFDNKSEQTQIRLAADRAIYEPLTAYQGAVSAEHGIGFEKKMWLSQSRSAEEIAFMKMLKKTIDPRGILNPNLIFD